MKDLYSFNVSVADLDAFYEQAAAAYLRIFSKLGIGDRTYRTFASGGAFSKFSDEFQTVIDSGEDTIYLSKEKGIAVNQEVLQDDVLQELGLQRDQLVEVRAIEVGNIFKLGTKYSEPLGLTFSDAEGKKHPVIMGSYGIGVGRLMATVVECLADDKGMIWPKNIAPFHVHLLELNASHDEAITAAVMDTIRQLEVVGIEVLHDDRDVTPGQKFADADLIGIPTRVVISAKTVAAGGHEVRDRATGNVESLTTEQLLSYVRGI